MMFGTYNRLGVHIYASDREVIAAAMKKLRSAARRGRKYRRERHQFFRQMLDHHKRARGLAVAFNL